MINGHGDDAYLYPEGIRTDFSSNICPHADHSLLMAHLAEVGDRLIGHYPEPEAWSLERMLAERHGISPKRVIVTSGATEAIYLVAQAFRLRPVIPQPTFSEYRDACRLFPPRDRRRSVLWLCNPNNPTGEVKNDFAVEEMARRYALAVVDQSYEVYSDELMLLPHLLGDTSNIIQLHSLTKTYAVPGLRLGYITTTASLAEVIRRYLRPWSVSALAVEAGKFLVEHQELIQHPDLAEAQRLWHALNALDGVEVLPTQTNFMLARLTAHPSPFTTHLSPFTAHLLKDYLARRHGLLIRDASNFLGLTPQHFRVAAQSPSENDALVSAIKDFIQHA